MKFLLLVRVHEDLAPGEFVDPEPWIAEAGTRRLEGGPLAWKSDATTVRDSGALVSDGPFAETKEQVAGYDVLECADLAEAVAIAARHPVAAFGAIEVRPFWTA
ncbi:YciI family protein [Actinocorallia longicatena]|uniref:YCII-related domain-containing protein n=1 Tax=Actinocorallia longicatena TaxID=111803 RepID=A0ABP6QLY5_9ACTN